MTLHQTNYGLLYSKQSLSVVVLINRPIVYESIPAQSWLSIMSERSSWQLYCIQSTYKYIHLPQDIVRFLSKKILTSTKTVCNDIRVQIFLHVRFLAKCVELFKHCRKSTKMHCVCTCPLMSCCFKLSPYSPYVQLTHNEPFHYTQTLSNK